MRPRSAQFFGANAHKAGVIADRGSRNRPGTGETHRMSNDRLTTSSGVTGPAGPVTPEPSTISARTSAPPGLPAVFGRAEPLRAARAALAVTGSVVLSGPAGIGKSTLLDLLAVESVEDGARVLRTAPAETEAG